MRLIGNFKFVLRYYIYRKIKKTTKCVQITPYYGTYLGKKQPNKYTSYEDFVPPMTKQKNRKLDDNSKLQDQEVMTELKSLSLLFSKFLFEHNCSFMSMK